jgi:hypothetical protein
VPRKSRHVVGTSETTGTMWTTGEVKGGAVIDGEYRVIKADPKTER